MFSDGVIESSSTTGTGTYTLSGAVFSGQTFAQGFSAGGSVAYFAQTADKSKWEFGVGVLTVGPPRTLTRATILKSSNAGSAIDWQATDTYYVFSIASADVLAGLIKGSRASSLPWWITQGGSWLDESASGAWTTARVIEKLRAVAADVEKGRFEAADSMFVPSPRRPVTAVGAAGRTVGVNDIGRRFTLNTAAAARTVTLPPIASAGVGFTFDVMGLSTANGIVLAVDAGDTGVAIDFGAAAASKNIPGQVLVTVWAESATQWRTTYAPAWAGVRQTVAAGPISTAGLPTFLPATNSTLSITTQNVAAAAPLVASAAGGWSGAGQPLDAVGMAVANLTWSGLTASRAAATPNYLYGTIAGGVITPGVTILAPIYQWAGTPSVTNGQITFNIAEMKCYLGNGSAAPQVNLVMFGEAATDGSGVISTVAYAYNGRWDSVFAAPLYVPGASEVVPKHNIGVRPEKWDVVLECTVADSNFVPGDRISLIGGNLRSTSSSGAAAQPIVVRQTPKTMGVSLGNDGTWAATNPNDGGGVYLTASNWKYKFTAERGW